MSEPLTVRTSFNNISELAQGYVNRVTAEQLILPAPAPLAEGDWLQFIVILQEGTPAFAGVGRCIKVADRGQRADPESRYELILDSLGFEDDSRAVFEHMVIVRDAMLGPQQEVARSQSQPESEPQAEPPIEEQLAVEAEAPPEAAEQEQLSIGDGQDTMPEVVEAVLPELEAEAHAEPAEETPVEPELAVVDAEEDEDDLQQLEAETLQSDEQSEQQQLEPEPEAAQPAYVSEPPAPSEPAPSGPVPSEPVPSEPVPFEPAPSEPAVAASPEQPPSGTILTRRAIAWFWQPQPGAEVASYPAGGLFEYGSDMLPVPASPPRPELDPSLWVRPAPRARGAAQSLPAGAVSQPPVAPSVPPRVSSQPPPIPSSPPSTASVPPVDEAPREAAFASEPPGEDEVTLASYEEAEPFPEELTSDDIAEEDAGGMNAPQAAEWEPVDDIDGTVSQSEEGGLADASDDPDKE